MNRKSFYQTFCMHFSLRYNLLKHIFIFQKYNFLLGKTKKLEEVNQNHWKQFQIFYRMTTSQILYNHFNEYFLIINQYINKSISIFEFIEKFIFILLA